MVGGSAYQEQQVARTEESSGICPAILCDRAEPARNLLFLVGSCDETPYDICTCALQISTELRKQGSG